MQVAFFSFTWCCIKKLEKYKDIFRNIKKSWKYVKEELNKLKTPKAKLDDQSIKPFKAINDIIKKINL